MKYKLQIYGWEFSAYLYKGDEATLKSFKNQTELWHYLQDECYEVDCAYAPNYDRDFTELTIADKSDNLVYRFPVRYVEKEMNEHGLIYKPKKGEAAGYCLEWSKGLTFSIDIDIEDKLEDMDLEDIKKNTEITYTRVYFLDIRGEEAYNDILTNVKFFGKEYKISEGLTDTRNSHSEAYVVNKKQGAY